MFSHGFFPGGDGPERVTLNGVVKSETSELNLWIKRSLCFNGDQQDPPVIVQDEVTGCQSAMTATD